MLLLPPSEGKAEGGTGRWSAPAGVFGGLHETRQAVVAAMAEVLANGGELSRVTGTRGALAERARSSWELLVAGRAPVLPAWQRFTGVVWEHLGPESLSDVARRRIIVVCGLAGLVLGTDPVPDFRLKMDVSLPGLGRLDRLWRPALAEALQAHTGSRTVVNLLPAEHARALGPLEAQVEVSFRSRTGTAVGHAAKAAKGMVARTLLEGGLAAADGFEWEGWSVRRRAVDRIEVLAP